MKLSTQRRPIHKREIARLAAVVAIVGSIVSAGVLLLGCGGGGRAANRVPASAVGLAEGAKLDRATAARLGTSGLGEIFVPAGRLAVDGALSDAKWPALPSGNRIVLWISADGLPSDASRVAERLVEALRSRRLEAESFGWTVSGFFLDLSSSSAASPAAATSAQTGALDELIERCRGALGESAWVSVSVPRVPSDDWKAAGQAADLVVWQAYGQAPGEATDNAAWDLLEVESRFAEVAGWGRPVLVRLRTLATLARSNGEGTTEFALGALARDRRLRLQEGFAFSGVDRVTYEWRVEDRLPLGAWNLARGERLTYRGVRRGSLEDLARRLRSKPQFAGLLFDRLPTENESASPGVEAMAGIVGPRESAPPGNLQLEFRGNRSGRSATLRVRLSNPTGLSSEIAMMGVNFVEIEVEEGSFGDVDPGFFFRYEFLRKGETRPSVAAMRSPERVRLFVPLLEPGEAFETGPIEVRFSGSGGGVKGFAEFMGQDGRVLKAPETRWVP